MRLTLTNGSPACVLASALGTLARKGVRRARLVQTRLNAMTMEYESFQYSREEAEKLLGTADSQIIARVLVGIIFGIDDKLWIQNTLISYIHFNDYDVANNAIVGLEDLVRFNENLDIPKIEAALRSVVQGPHRTTADEALAGIKEFMDRRRASKR